MTNRDNQRSSVSPWGDPLLPAPAGRRYPLGSPNRARTPWEHNGRVGTSALRLPARRDWEPGRMFRAARASMALLVISLGLGLAFASALGLVFWALASAIHHASS